MGIMEKIFGRREQPAGLKNAQVFKLLEGYTPAFTTWRGSIYESELIRASLDAWGRHAAKLKPNLRGSAEEELQNRLKVKANPFQEWSKFLYQTATVLGVRNTAFLVKTRDEYNRTTGIINILPQQFFLHCAALIAGLIFVTVIAFFAADAFWRRNQKKNAAK